MYPREVEDALATHPDVRISAVIGAPDPKWGEAVLAVVALRPGALTSPDDIIAYLKRLKGPLLAPKIGRFVDQLPLTTAGKVDKKALREIFAAQPVMGETGSPR